MVLHLSCQLSKLGDIVVNVAFFHFKFIELGGGFVVGIRIVPILDEILFKFFCYDLALKSGRF